jgi:hypothetical protein
MIMFMEKIDSPPLVPLTDEEQLDLKLEELASDDLWVRNIIDAMVGVIRHVKH